MGLPQSAGDLHHDPGLVAAQPDPGHGAALALVSVLTAAVVQLCRKQGQVRPSRDVLDLRTEKAADYGNFLRDKIPLESDHNHVRVGVGWRTRKTP